MKKDRGFSITELMITVVIVSIVASIAIPSYMEQARKGRRSDGTALLTEIRNLQERFYLENNTYTVTATDFGYAAGTVKSHEQFYQAQIENPAGCAIASCYNLLATPIADVQKEDGRLRLWSDGRKEREVDGAWKSGWD